MRRLRLAIAGLALVAIGIVWSVASSGRAHLPRLADGVTGLKVRPSVVSYTGDGSGFLGGFDGTGGRNFGHLRWSRWTKTQAVGSGADWSYDRCGVPRKGCVPGFNASAVTVRAFRPIEGRFTRLNISYRFKGKKVLDRRGLRIVNASQYGPGYYDWYIIGYRPSPPCAQGRKQVACTT